MQAEYGRAETDTQARSRYLKEMMHIRKVSAKDLSLMTGISRRTIERYMNGRTDTADAAGLTVAKICFVLGMNVYTLGGVDDVKPGTAFGSDGKEAVVKKYDLLPYSRNGVRDVLKWYMKRNGMKRRSELAERMGMKERTVNDMLSLQVDVRMMRARVIFAACRKMVLHPYFLYGFRDIKEYPRKKSNKRHDAQRVFPETGTPFFVCTKQQKNKRIIFHTFYEQQNGIR